MPSGTYPLEVRLSRVGERWQASSLDDRPVRLQASLPARADGEVRLTDGNTGFGIAFRFASATSVTARASGAFAFYQGAGPGMADVLLAARAGSLEDLARVSDPQVHELRYAVDVSRVAGLRLVANSLEFVDAGGAPRLRISAPFLIDAQGQRRDARLSVLGCAFDSSPAPPWRRPVTPPGGAGCDVRVTWDTEGLRYPVLVDPLWSLTKALGDPRVHHTATLVPADLPTEAAEMVCVIGGYNTPQEPLGSVECFDQASNSWAAAMPMPTGRYDHSATLLLDNQILVVGGTGKAGQLDSCARFDPRTGKWSDETTYATLPRTLHTATRLDDGSVVVIGGGSRFPLFLNKPHLSAVLDWRLLSTPMAVGRFGHTAVLAGGDIFVAGGSSTVDLQNPLDSAETFVPTEGDQHWLDDGRMNVARVQHTATLLPAHQSPDNPLGELILVAGQNTDPQLFEPRSRTWSATAAHPEFRRVRHAAVALPQQDGNTYVMLIGGDSDQTNPYDHSEIFSRDSGQWLQSPPLLSEPREGHTATLLGDDKTVLVVGGERLARIYADGELSSFSKAGEPCQDPADCLTGTCSMKGTCCNTACGGDCQACTVMEGAKRDGVCTLLRSGKECGKKPSACELASSCDGVSPLCPEKKEPAPDDTDCSTDTETGTCHAGSCVPDNVAGAGGQGGSSSDESGGAGATAGEAGSGGTGGGPILHPQPLVGWTCQCELAKRSSPNGAVWLFTLVSLAGLVRRRREVGS